MWVKNSDELYHRGKKGMKWGYNDGKRNGKRTAGGPEDENAAAERFVEEYGTNIGGYSFKGYENGYAIYVSDDDPNKTRRYKYSFEKKNANEKIETNVTRVTADGKKFVEETVDETIHIGTSARKRKKAMEFVGSLAKFTVYAAVEIGKGINKTAKEANKVKVGMYDNVDQK